VRGFGWDGEDWGMGIWWIVGDFDMRWAVRVFDTRWAIGKFDIRWAVGGINVVTRSR
jgi:hypothetical protein